MIITIGFHSTVEFYSQLDSREINHPDETVAVLSAVSDLASVKQARHIIIFDTPYALARIENAYQFDYRIVSRNPLKFARKNPLWGTIRSLRVQPPLRLSINSEINVTQQIIDSQRKNDVIDKVNRLKEFLPTDRMEKVIAAYAEFLMTGDADALKKTLLNIVAKNKQKDDCLPIIADILAWSVTPPAIRLIAAMKEVGPNWRDTYEKISHSRGIRPFELSFFLVAYERSSNG